MLYGVRQGENGRMRENMASGEHVYENEHFLSFSFLVSKSIIEKH